MAQEIIAASAGLAGKVAKETSLFMRAAIPRGKASEIMNMSERNARRIVSVLLKQGLLESASHRAPLTIGLPIHVLPFYFPDLYDPSVMGAVIGDMHRIP